MKIVKERKGEQELLKLQKKAKSTPIYTELKKKYDQGIINLEEFRKELIKLTADQ